MSDKKVKAARLTLGHAPNTWHVVEGLPGFYHPLYPTPIGGPMELTDEQAQASHKDEGCPLEVFTISDSEAAKAREEQARLRGESIRAAREQVHEAEAAKVNIESAAVSGKE